MSILLLSSTVQAWYLLLSRMGLLECRAEEGQGNVVPGQAIHGAGSIGHGPGQQSCTAAPAGDGDSCVVRDLQARLS